MQDLQLKHPYTSDQNQETGRIKYVYYIETQETGPTQEKLENICAAAIDKTCILFFDLCTTICSELRLITNTSLSYLCIRYNSLTALRENELSGLENLKLLLLHSNSIHSIEDRSFQDLKSLQVKSHVCDLFI